MVRENHISLFEIEKEKRASRYDIKTIVRKPSCCMLDYSPITVKTEPLPPQISQVL